MNNTSLIKITTLETEYKILLNQYDSAYKNYINILQKNAKIGDFNYSQVIGNGGLCTGSTGSFPDGMWEKIPGNYPQIQCQALCDENPYCSGYNLVGPKDSNNNASCHIFADTNANAIHNPNAYGCYKKKNFVKPSTTNTTIIPNENKSSNNKLNEFVELQGRQFWGTAPLNQGPVDSLEQCESMCASDMNCTGATFQSDINYCYTRTGQTDVVSGKSTDYALIPEKRQALLTLQMLNNKLLNIIQQINIEFKKIKPEVNEEQIEKNTKKIVLNNTYAALLGEQQIITDNLNEYANLEKEYENHSLMTNQENILLKFWSFFALILLAITFKFVFNVEGSSLIFLIITVLIILIFLSLNWWSLIPVVFLPLLIKMIYFS
jgi:hypothetical protein